MVWGHAGAEQSAGKPAGFQVLVLTGPLDMYTIEAVGIQSVRKREAGDEYYQNLYWDDWTETATDDGCDLFRSP